MAAVQAPEKPKQKKKPIFRRPPKMREYEVEVTTLLPVRAIVRVNARRQKDAKAQIRAQLADVGFEIDGAADPKKLRFKLTEIKPIQLALPDNEGIVCPTPIPLPLDEDPA